MGIPVTKEILERDKPTRFIQVQEYVYGNSKLAGNGQMVKVSEGTTQSVAKAVNWRANGKLKTWKRDAARFQLPIKHGLYSYSYITEENMHLFEVA